MKYIYTIIAIMILASCTATQNENNIDNNKGDEITTQEINDAVSDLDKINNDTTENKIIKVNATYKNTKQEVEMVINYSLDTEGKIKEINVNAENWDLSDYNEAVQEVIGKSLDEASNFSVSGASLTSKAFQNALK